MAETALLIMDVQQHVVEHYAPDPESLLPALERAGAAARAAGVSVVYVRLGYREGLPEVSRRNRGFAVAAGSREFYDDSPSTAIHAAIAPQPGDIVVTKKRVSAFTGSDLDVLLRSLGVTQLVLGGIATSGVVLSTLRQAADLDFGLTVLRDGCADPDDEVHRVLLDKVFPRQADVLEVDDWIASLRADA
ncbi:MAG TPA: isochorismatase family cysteine hydrolase [Mycobacteriales bacterium]|nr:isochorismatase family cysteine hydrolase [Mycobacteriales bacterium]